MIDLFRFPIFYESVSTLKETSADRRDPETELFMTQSERTVVNMDAVKDRYAEPLSLSAVPKSVDALFTDKNGTLVFVEFKNGSLDRKKQFDVRKKVYDSILIFNDITATKASDLRENAELIVVYNDSVNTGQEDPVLKEKKVFCAQLSPSYDALVKAVSGLAKKEYICFGMECFQNYCFKAVHTYTENEFEEYLKVHDTNTICKTDNDQT